MQPPVTGPASLLFEPIRLGRVLLRNRIVMAPMTRSRATPNGLHHPLTPSYYGQRATAGLLIAEATAVSRQGAGYPLIPGLWTDLQESSLRLLIEAVHAREGKIFVQLFHMGRVAHRSLTGGQPIAPSPIAPEGQTMDAEFQQQSYETPRPMSTAEIAGVVGEFAGSALRAIQAGADGVEIHAANGYLIDQFLRDGTNQRTDGYGGSPERRARFLAEVGAATAASIGGDRVGVRLSPFNSFNSMSDSDPRATFVAAARALKPLGLAYLHVIEQGGRRDAVIPREQQLTPELASEFGGSMMANGGYSYESAQEALRSGWADTVAFGIPYISNPDLVERFRAGAPLAEADPATFYGGGARGYTDYPTWKGTPAR